MARAKLSEFRAKKNIFDALDIPYEGIEIDSEKLDSTHFNRLDEKKYVVKVDQAIKKRNKLGLVKLNLSKSELSDAIKDMAAKGYRYFLVEPMVVHIDETEHFFAMQLVEDGVEIQYSENGGVDVESNRETIQTTVLSIGEEKFEAIGDISSKVVESLFGLFLKSNMTYLEINPFMIEGDHAVPLDAAVEIDTVGMNVSGNYWTKDDLRYAVTTKTNSEMAVEKLQSKSSSSLALRVLNPNGSLFLLLSGGGASVVIADEISAHGFVDDIANYGEYSGNPNEDEVYHYTLAILDLIKDSAATSKSLIIAGGIANFTDIAKSFEGIKKALSERRAYLNEIGLSVYVRRGGPNQVRGLKLMDEFLTEIELAHQVSGPDVSIGNFIEQVVKARSL